MRYLFTFLAVATLCLASVASQASEADALAEAGASFVAMGKVDKAKDILYRALANDENCPLALYELGKLFQAEGDTISAVNFFTKTILLMQNSSKPEYTSKIVDSKARLQTLNPYAGHFTQVFEEYATDLTTICKKSNDSVTCTEALDRVQSLNMGAYLSPEKMPNIPRPAKPIPATGTGVGKNTASSTPTAVPLEIERALKAAGWTTITGTWKKKSEGVYEVTDGKLETPKINGGIKLLVDQGGTGSVSVFVRNAQKDPMKGRSSFMGTSALGSMTTATGFGCTITSDLSCKVFAPQGFGMGMNADVNYSYLEHTTPLTNLPKHDVMVTVKDSELHILVDGKKEKNSYAKITKEGPFTVEIKGTMTIEDPKAAEY